MKFIKKSSENEMILEFLRGELQSNRFRGEVVKSISECNTTADIIMNPDLKNGKENALRKQILTVYRGYGTTEGLFENFPSVTSWNWEQIEKSDLHHIKYINYSYWNDLSSNTGSPLVAANNIKQGITSCGVSNEGFINAAENLKKEHSFSPIILLKDYNETICIVLEGHLRITAYALADYDMINISCLVGYCSKKDLLIWDGSDA